MGLGGKPKQAIALSLSSNSRLLQVNFSKFNFFAGDNAVRYCERRLVEANWHNSREPRLAEIALN